MFDYEDSQTIANFPTCDYSVILLKLEFPWKTQLVSFLDRGTAIPLGVKVYKCFIS